MTDTQKSLIEEVAFILGAISNDEDLIVLLKEAMDNYDLLNHDDFIYILGKVDAMSFAAAKMEKYIDAEANDNVHRSELWRNAVISATSARHNDPTMYADKVLEHYDSKFSLK